MRDHNMLAPVPRAVDDDFASQALAADSLLTTLRRHFKLASGAFLICLVCGLAYLLLAPRIYTGRARLYVQSSAPRIMGDNVVQAGSLNYLYTQREIISSAPILSMALARSDVSTLKTLDGQPNALMFLRKALQVEVGKKDDLITVSLDSRYGEEATRIVENVVDSYRQFSSGQSKSKASDVLAILLQEQRQCKADLERVVHEALKFKESNGTLSFDNDQLNATRQRLVSLLDALGKAHLESINAKSTYDEAVRSMGESPEVSSRLAALSPSVIPSSADELTRLQNEIAQAHQVRQVFEQQGMLPSHQSIVTIQARIEEMSLRYIAAAKNRWKAAEQVERDLKTSYDDQQKAGLELDRKTAVYGQLDAEVKRLQRMSETLETRINEVDLTQDSGALTINVVEPAGVYDKPSPRGATTLGAAAALGILLAMGLAVTKEKLHPMLRQVADVEGSLGIRVLAAIPRAEIDSTRPIAGGPAAMGYQSLCRSVLESGDPRTILITSPKAGEGKSTVAANLGLAMAAAGERVLIIDANHRSPMQASFFGIDTTLGLDDVLSGDIDSEDAIRPAIARVFLLSGSHARAGIGLMRSNPRVEQLISSLGRRYDRVLIDTQMATDSDTRTLASFCDATLLVVRDGQCDRQSAESACDALWSVGATLGGVVVNDVPRRSPWLAANRRRNGEVRSATSSDAYGDAPARLSTSSLSAKSS